jgi:hypothetical protein
MLLSFITARSLKGVVRTFVFVWVELFQGKGDDVTGDERYDCPKYLKN